jgi:plasmid maintenance system antidote protein VapI
MPTKASAAHPLDAGLRARLRHDAALNQTELAKRIGRKPAWLNKYINGAGHATIDDVIRIVAVVNGLDAQLTAAEQRLVWVWRHLKAENQPYALDAVELVYRRQRKGAGGRLGRTPRGGARKGPDTR